MHPRNPYSKCKPDFAELGKKHPFLAPFVTVVKGKGHVDFKNKDALRALTRAILLEDFNLNVIIPLDSLVPVIPQRLNYILWIEDLFKQSPEQLCGLDIGTGGSAIYALLCARKNNWKMVGTDIVEESIEFASKNIERNGLNQLVKAQLVHETIKGNFFAEVTGDFHFSMCNPPFFSSEEETDSLAKARKLNRSLPSAAKTGTSHELVAQGGEVEFLSSMITESRVFASKVGIFTTLVGIKADLKFLTDALKVNQALNYTTTKFVQGKTMRWGLAWTFKAKYAHLFSTQKSSSPPVRAQLRCNCAQEKFVLKVKTMLSDLQFRFLDITNGRIEVVAENNTWSNQRRKRRAATRNQDPLDKSEAKRVKISELHTVESPQCSSEFLCADLKDYEGRDFGLHMEILFGPKPVENGKELILKYIGGILGVDAVHQVIQYFKNIYAKHACLDKFMNDVPSSNNS